MALNNRCRNIIRTQKGTLISSPKIPSGGSGPSNLFLEVPPAGLRLAEGEWGTAICVEAFRPMPCVLRNCLVHVEPVVGDLLSKSLGRSCDARPGRL